MRKTFDNLRDNANYMSYPTGQAFCCTFRPLLPHPNAPLGLSHSRSPALNVSLYRYSPHESEPPSAQLYTKPHYFLQLFLSEPCAISFRDAHLWQYECRHSNSAARRPLCITFTTWGDRCTKCLPSTQLWHIKQFQDPKGMAVWPRTVVGASLHHSPPPF